MAPRADLLSDSDRIAILCLSIVLQTKSDKQTHGPIGHREKKLKTVKNGITYKSPIEIPR